MAAGNFQACLDVVLRLEGGFVDNAKDKGGATNLGVTIATWSAWIGRPATVQDIRDLTPESVSLLYQAGFWRAVHADYLPLGIDLMVFDFAVNSGPRQAALTLQRALGVPADGLVGPVTLNAVRARPAASLIATYAGGRLDFLKTLDNFATFGRGWQNRVAAVSLAAKAMIPAA